MVYDKFLVALADMADYDADKNESRMKDVIAAPLASAQAKGLLHPRLSGDDILTACRMMASHWRLDNEQNFLKTFERRFELVLRGLSAPSRRAKVAINHTPGKDRKSPKVR